MVNQRPHQTWKNMDVATSAPKKPIGRKFPVFSTAMILLICLVCVTLIFTGCTNCPEKCEGKCYDPRSQSCCNGEVYPGNMTPCGNTCCNPDTQVCYRGIVYNGTYWKILGSWEAESNNQVSMTFLENGSVLIDPFPKCENSLVGYPVKWSCTSSVLSNGRWSYDEHANLYELTFNYADVWTGPAIIPTYSGMGAGFDPSADYNQYRIVLPDIGVQLTKTIRDSCTFTAHIDPNDPNVLRLSLLTKPVNKTFEQGISPIPYSVEWIEEKYGTWKYAPEKYLADSAQITPTPSSIPGASLQSGSSSQEEIEITDYTVHFFNDGTLTESFTYHVNIPEKYFLIQRYGQLPLTMESADIPHAVLINVTTPQSVTWYLKDNKGNVTISNSSLEGLKEMVETGSKENELGLFKLGHFAVETCPVVFTYKYHPSMNVDEHYAYVKIRLPESTLPYGNVTIVLPAEYVVKLYPQPEDLNVVKEGDTYILSGYGRENTPLGFDVLFSNKIAQEMEGFSKNI